jgi:formate hydrogenlyase transcriptional activator
MVAGQTPEPSPHHDERESGRLRLQLERTQLQIEVSNVIVSKLSLKELLVTISNLLKQFINHDFASVVLYDEKKQELRVHALDQAPPGGVLDEGVMLPMEGTPPGIAITTRKTVRRDHIDLNEFHALIMRQAYAAGLRSGCSVPLISHDRILGTINVGCLREAALTADDQQLLEQIATQVAIAVDNALNFERAERERRRSQLLLEINNAVTSHLDLEQLVRSISGTLRDVIPHEMAGIALYEPEMNHLREYSNVSYKDRHAFKVGDTIPIEGTPAGHVFTTGEPMLIKRPDLTRFPADRNSQLPAEESPKSACLTLLVSHGRKLGIAGVASTEEEKFTEADLELFTQITNQIAIAVENALAYREIETLKNTLASEKLYLEEEIKSEFNFAEIVGQSAALKKILRQVETVAPTDSAVLLFGETGTGKELIARAIHDLSRRRERTLVKLNCAAIPTGLLESELFGHEKGAFTGAIAQRIGRFELAHKGTLLLDEIGEIPLELQPKLLRVLQEHEFERLGSSRTIKTDARLIAATNCDLPQMVAEKKFRSDLFYRLNVFPINIPPLRDRVDDIPLLAGYFTQKHALRMNKRIRTIDKQTIDALSAYRWPGNVRELENFIERAVILTTGSELQAPLAELAVSSNGDKVAQPAVAGGPAPVSLADAERAHIEEILRQTRGVIGGKGGAAELLGLPISTLRNRMKKLGLK